MAIYIILIALFIAYLSIMIKKSNIIYCFILLFLMCLCVFCRESYDLSNYEYAYNYVDVPIGVRAPLFDIFTDLCKDFNLSFLEYKAIIAFTSLSLVSCAIRKNTYFHTLVLALYMIYPFMGIVTQMRNGLAAAIVIYTIYKFINDSKHSSIKYIIGIFIACMFHYSSIVYLFFVLSKKSFSNKKFFIFISCFFLLILIAINTDIIFNFFAPLISNKTVLSYLDFAGSQESRAMYNSLPTQILTISGHLFGFSIFYLIYLSYKNLLSMEGNISLKNRNSRFYYDDETLSFLFRFFSFSLCLLPLYLLSPTYFRLYKNILPILYIFLSQYVFLERTMLHQHKQANALILITILYAMIVFSISAYTVGGTIDTLNSFFLSFK